MKKKYNEVNIKIIIMPHGSMNKIIDGKRKIVNLK